MRPCRPMCLVRNIELKHPSSCRFIAKPAHVKLRDHFMYKSFGLFVISMDWQYTYIYHNIINFEDSSLVQIDTNTGPSNSMCTIAR